MCWWKRDLTHRGADGKPSSYIQTTAKRDGLWVVTRTLNWVCSLFCVLCLFLFLFLFTVIIIGICLCSVFGVAAFWSVDAATVAVVERE